MEQIKLNTIPSGVPSVCHISQFDDTSRIIRCHLFNDADPLTLTGSETIRLFVRKSDNSRAEFGIESTSGTFIDLVITSEMSDIAGDSECKFQITDSEKTIGTLNFKMVVEPDAYGDSLKTRSISGPIATFETDLAEDLIKLDVDLEPIQDLHRYDNPWPAGGGKNIFNMTAENGQAGQKYTATGTEGNITLESIGTYGRVGYVVEGLIIGETYTFSADIAHPIASGKNCAIYFTDTIEWKNRYGQLSVGKTTSESTPFRKTITATSTTLFVGFYITADNAYGDVLVVKNAQVEKGSTATAYEPYSNICPISGHDSAQLFRINKNLLEKPFAFYSQVSDDLSEMFFIKAGTYIVAFNETDVANWRFAIRLKDINGNNLSTNEFKPENGMDWRDQQKFWLDGANSSRKYRVLNIIKDCYIRILFGFGETTATTVFTDVQLELGSTASDYEPYSSDPTPITVQFGQTIYKGRVISESDLIEITHVCETFDGSSDEQWVTTSSPSVRYGFRIYFQSNKKPTAKATDEMLSSTIPLCTTSEAASVDDDIITCRSTTYLHKIFYIFAPPSKISTVEELRAFLANEPETVMYPLDEHIFLKISDLFMSDNEPYLSRQSGGSVEVLDREIDSLVGGTIGWNQISALTKASSESYGIITEISNGLLTIIGTPTQSSGQWRLMLDTRFSAIPTGHKLLLCGNTEHFWFGVQGADTTKTTKTQKEIMLEASSTTIADIVIMMANMDTSVAVNESVHLQLFDLTVMFGSVIADYIYSLEQATAGAGIAWFRERFPKNYYQYNAGQLISVKTSKHVTTGKNLLSPHLYKGINYNPNVGTVITFSDSSKQFVDNGDGTFSVSTNSNWETFDLVFKLIKNTTCYRKILFTTTNMLAVSEVYLDSNLEVIWKNSNTAISQLKDSVITPPEGAAYYVMVFSNRATADPTTLTITEPQIELGSTATDYTPYVGHEYPLDPNLELRGIPKLDGNKMYYDGDTYESSGSVTRKYGIVDLGTMTWTATPITNAGNRFYSGNLYNAKKPSVTSIIPNMICSKYEAKLVSAYSQAVNGITISTNGAIQVYDVNMSSLTAAQFKTAMSGVYLVYELDTPTTESAASFENPQKVDPNGIEMYEDVREIPLAVGHETKYLLNPDKPTIVTALVGTNNVYSDAGDVDVEYYTTLEGGND